MNVLLDWLTPIKDLYVPDVLLSGLVGAIGFSLLYIFTVKMLRRKLGYWCCLFCGVFGALGAVVSISLVSAYFWHFYPNKMYKCGDVPDGAVICLIITFVARIFSVFIGGVIGCVLSLITVVNKKEINGEKAA